MVAQVVATPMSFVLNAVMARYLGPEDFGKIYLAGTFCAFGFLFVEWGQGSLLPAMVARDRIAAGELLGTGLVWRMMAAPVVYVLIAAGCLALGYGREFQITLGLVALGSVFSTFVLACQDTVRGFERTDVAAYAAVGQPLLGALIVVPTLVLGGRLRAAVAAQALVYAVMAWFVWRALRSISKSRLSFSSGTLKALAGSGTSFFAMSLSMALQPNVDALLLSKFAPVEVVGWHAAARKLVGVLVFPATALMTAFYPTLSRLYAEDREGFKRTAAGYLRASMVVVVPLALGCGLYPDLGIRVYSRHAFGPAEDNLRFMSPFILLLYFSMMLGTALAAAGLQRPWAMSQFVCVVVSAVLDPLLVPWFQARSGNGGLGICVSTVLSEALMVVAGVWLAPPGILDRSLVRGLGLALLAGGAMVLVARCLSGTTPFIAAPISVLAYGLCLWAIGGLDSEQLAMLRNAIGRRFARSTGRV
jgi:O-antigen/teichoic acid export membrane protein